MTASFSQKYPFNNSVFIILRDLIHQETGLYYDNPKKQMLADKLTPRLISRNLDSFLDYYYLLKYDDSIAQEEWGELMNALSVPETFFWREMDQIKALVEIIIPDYLKNCYLQKDGFLLPTFSQPLKIWSAACSTGEEPLTIAMALKEAGLLDKVPLKILASDGCQRSLNLAKQRLYREHSFRSLPFSLKSKYFTQKDNCWQISAQIHSYVNWQKANLLEPSDLQSLKDSRFIFCRNVFIYFSPESIKKTVDMFYEAMPSPSYLFIGASESLLKLDTKFEFQKIGDAFVYVKH